MSTDPTDVLRSQGCTRTQLREFALVHELGQAQVNGLASSCVFATHFAIDFRDASVPPTMLLVMPLHGTLQGALISATPTDLLRCLVEIAHALSAVHHVGLLHRDIAIRNVLHDASAGSVKLCDFGLSCTTSSPWQPPAIPLHSWPPEVVCTPSAEYGFSSDTWAFGLMLVDVLRRGEARGCVHHSRMVARSSVIRRDMDFQLLADILHGQIPASVSGAGDAAAGIELYVCPYPPPTEHVHWRYHWAERGFGCSDDGLSAGSDAEPDPDDARFLSCWHARTALSPHELMAFSPPNRALIRLLVSWCTHVDPVNRPSMVMVELLLRHAASGQPACFWAGLPETIVPVRLAETNWTVGDGQFLAALCRRRGRPLLVSHGQISDERVSSGGAQLLEGLKPALQVFKTSTSVGFASEDKMPGKDERGPEDGTPSFPCVCSVVGCRSLEWFCWLSLRCVYLI
jgi:hypothetical protein